MSKTNVVPFWFHKFRAVGFPPEIARLFAHTIESKGKWLKENHPLSLPFYLRRESEKHPQRHMQKPLNIIRAEEKSTLGLPGREIPQFELPKPPDYIFVNDFWVFKLMRYGLPPVNAELTAQYIAKQCYLMLPDVRGRWLRKNYSDEQNKAHADLVQKIRKAAGWSS
jgi:hypothetical protein